MDFQVYFLLEIPLARTLLIFLFLSRLLAHKTGRDSFRHLVQWMRKTVPLHSMPILNLVQSRYLTCLLGLKTRSRS